MMKDTCEVHDARTHRRRSSVVVLLWLGLTTLGTAKVQQDESQEGCRVDKAALVSMPELPEASGLAVSRQFDGRVWAHNDSSDPILYALNGRGRIVSRLRLSGAKVVDWEAVGTGPCPSGSCVYIADIGDNHASRRRITVYRVAEDAADGSVPDALHATYPDGAQDAETLLVTPDRTLYVVTKGQGRPVSLYRFPRDLRAGATHRLERIGQPRADSDSRSERVTDGAVSSDGVWVVLRTRTHVAFHRLADLKSGRWREARRVDLTPLGEVQGEGVALGRDGTLFLAGEGGGKSRPGTFARLRCPPPLSTDR